MEPQPPQNQDRDPSRDQPSSDVLDLKIGDVSGESDHTRIIQLGSRDDSDLFDIDLTSPKNRPVPMKLPEQIGEYRLGEMIGSGGMGQVFLAQHVRMQRTVAIKVLPVDTNADVRSVERFYDEVRAAAKLMHPNIVTALDAGEIGSVHYLAMEYVHGVNLATMVASGGPVSVPDAAAIIRQAAMGLLHAHRAGIVHRDVKPGNLMRATDGTIKVLDLGLARVSGPVSADSETNSIGTLPYMAPEQLENSESADSRSDIYSLGATMFYLLTGQSPYTGDYLQQVYGHRHGPIPDLMEVCSDVDLNFASIFERMMAKSPDQRFTSLDEVIEALAPYASDKLTPTWLSEFVQRQESGDTSTFSSATSDLRSESVMGIDLGMFHAVAAQCRPDGELQDLTIDGQRKLFRCILACDDTGITFGDDANRRRAVNPISVVHCLPMYLGRKTLPRAVAGVTVPPEAAIGLMLRHIVEKSWPHPQRPQAIAIPILAGYDQMHRRAIEQAATMSGLTMVRLIDRSLAAATALVTGQLETSMIEASLSGLQSAAPGNYSQGSSSQGNSSQSNSSQGDSSMFDVIAPAPPVRQNILYVGLSGQGSETVVLRAKDKRLKQIASGGHWKVGSMVFLQRLTEMATEQMITQHGFDPRSKLENATALQMACEQAMATMAIFPTATINVRQRRIEISREVWLGRCRQAIDNLKSWVVETLKNSGRRWSEIDHILLFGPLLRIGSLRQEILEGNPQRAIISHVDRSAVARGAALCLSAQMPGRTDHPPPPRSVTSQTIGLMVNDKNGRRRILPLINKGTLTPARVNRRVTADRTRQTMSIAVAESSGIQGQSWQTLGKDDIQIEADEAGSISRMISFEVDINGLLSIRVQGVGGPGSIKLPPLPTPNLTEAEVAIWKRWVDANSPRESFKQ
jgi:eukaryotic-like serine/threonine-protein kinase